MARKKAKSKSDRTLQMVHPNAAAIDVGATLLMAAVRADRAADPVRSFGTFTTVLHRLVDWFAECGVDTVAMESTSVYWIPIYELLDAAYPCGRDGDTQPDALSVMHGRWQRSGTGSTRVKTVQNSN